MDFVPVVLSFRLLILGPKSIFKEGPIRERKSLRHVAAYLYITSAKRREKKRSDDDDENDGARVFMCVPKANKNGGCSKGKSAMNKLSEGTYSPKETAPPCFLNALIHR